MERWSPGEPGLAGSTGKQYRSWKVMEFKIEIFQTWKVMESDLGPGKSWKINHKLNCEHYGLPFFNSDLVTNHTHFCGAFNCVQRRVSEMT